MPLFVKLLFSTLQKFGRLVLWEAMFILELHSAETQEPDGEVPDNLLKDLLDKSYQLVLGGFSKKKQREILEVAQSVNIISCCGTDCSKCVSGLDVCYFFVSNGDTTLLYGTSCVGAGWSKFCFY